MKDFFQWSKANPETLVLGVLVAIALGAGFGWWASTPRGPVTIGMAVAATFLVTFLVVRFRHRPR